MISRHSRLEGLALLGVVGAAGDHPQEVVGQHKRHALPADAELLLEVTQEVAEVDVEDLTNRRRESVSHTEHAMYGLD